MNYYSTQALRKTQQVILSVPLQIFLFITLGSLSLWTLYFSSYPATHNTMHQARHHTLGIGCH
jgi:Na+/glutamate symporter